MYCSVESTKRKYFVGRKNCRGRYEEEVLCRKKELQRKVRSTLLLLFLIRLKVRPRGRCKTARATAPALILAGCYRPISKCGGSSWTTTSFPERTTSTTTSHTPPATPSRIHLTIIHPAVLYSHSTFSISAGYASWISTFLIPSSHDRTRSLELLALSTGLGTSRPPSLFTSFLSSSLSSAIFPTVPPGLGRSLALRTEWRRTRRHDRFASLPARTTRLGRIRPRKPVPRRQWAAQTDQVSMPTTCTT